MRGFRVRTYVEVEDVPVPLGRALKNGRVRRETYADTREETDKELRVRVLKQGQTPLGRRFPLLVTTAKGSFIRQKHIDYLSMVPFGS